MTRSDGHETTWAMTPRDAELLALHAEGLLDHELATELRDRLRAAPELLMVLAELADIEQQLGSLFEEEWASDRSDWFVLMAELDQSSGRAGLVEVAQGFWDSGDRRAVKGWLAPGLAVAGACAAVLIFGFSLWLLVDGLNPGKPEAAEQLPVPDAATLAMAPGPDPIVATISGQSDAAWAGSPGQPRLGVGSDLRVGQRLTLESGFAQITTNRGAVAILEGPATVELLDHDNAIRLHAGKLFGICETESSKGFVVRTPHLSITDLGTQFGVDVSTNHGSKVHVFQGEVSVDHPDHLRERQALHLTTGQSAHASSARPEVFVIQQTREQIEQFKNVSVQFISLPGTGAERTVGETDPNWAVVEVNGRKLLTPQPVAVIDHVFYVLPRFQGQNFDPASQMIGYKPSAELPKDTPFVFESRFFIPDNVDLEAATLQLRYMADIYVQWVRINGQRVRLDQPARGWGEFATSVINEHLIHGENTIAFEVINSNPQNHDAQGDRGLVGLRLEWELRTINRLTRFPNTRDEP